MTTTFFGASCAPDATISGLPKIDRFHVPLARVPGPGDTSKPPRKPTRTDVVGAPPTGAFAARYVNSGGRRHGLCRTCRT